MEEIRVTLKEGEVIYKIPAPDSKTSPIPKQVFETLLAEFQHLEKKYNSTSGD